MGKTGKRWLSHLDTLIWGKATYIYSERFQINKKYVRDSSRHQKMKTFVIRGCCRHREKWPLKNPVAAWTADKLEVALQLPHDQMIVLVVLQLISQPFYNEIHHLNKWPVHKHFPLFIEKTFRSHGLFQTIQMKQSPIIHFGPLTTKCKILKKSSFDWGFGAMVLFWKITN